MDSVEQLKQKVNEFISVVNEIEIENAAAERSRKSLEDSITQLAEQNKETELIMI